MSMDDFLNFLKILPIPAYLIQGASLRMGNPAMARITGYSVEELAGMPIAGLVHQEDLPRINDVSLRFPAGGDDPVNLEWRAVGRRGEVIHLRGWHSRVKFDGRPAVLGLAVDNPGQKRTAEEIEKSEARLREVLDEIEDGYYEVDLAGNFTFFNRSLCRIGGYSPGELKGMNYRSYTAPEKQEAVFRTFNKIYTTGQPVKLFDYIILRKDGSKRFVENSVSLIRDSEGRGIGFRGIVRDITDRKLEKAEHDLLKAYFKELFDNSPEGIAIIDGNDRFVQVNRGFEKIFQYSAGEVRGRRVNELIVPPELSGQATDVSRRALGGEVVQMETVRKRKDGSLVDVSILAYPIAPGGGQAAIYVMYSDITERKRAREELQALNEELEAANEELMAAEEELKQKLAELQKSERALRESENKYRQLFHNANDGIILVEVKDDQRLGRVIEVNDVVCKMLEYGREEFLTLTVLDLVVGDQLNRVHEITRAALVQGRSTFELTCVSKSGHKIPLEIGCHIFTLNGERVGLLVARDITDRKLAEEKLRAANRQLQDIIEFLPDPTFALDIEKKVIAWNRAIEEMTGVPKDQIVGLGDRAYSVPFYGMPRPALIDLIFSDDREIASLYDNIERKGDTLFTEAFVPSLFEGRGAYIWVKASPLYDSRGNVVGAIESIRDITDRKRAEQQLKYLSLHDPLTGTYNRAYFEEEMRRLEGRRHKPLGIIVCDIDGLKLVNDTLGHKCGDDLLAAAAAVIKESFREGDMIARIGGDEFAILLPDSGRDVVEGACARIRTAVARYNEKNPGLPLSMSIGFSVSGQPGVSPAELFKEADNSMYREKLHRSQSARSAIVQTLMKALEARDFITEGHAERLQDLVTVMARSIGLPEQNITDLRLLAQFHDIGKVGVSDRILFKPGQLTLEEAAEMHRHCEIGHRIAQTAPGMDHIADWILKHHEWWNGNGYPIGLKGEEIPLECRILAIVDAYDAMTTDRPYRKAMSHEEAVAELKRCAGTQFDPDLVPVFIQAFEKGKNS
ncbi:MAG: PAS domain S-box protein [Peptococcaceae bacterium]|nr:PAS domain S-box protein [Peptococcaceae bacterium]